MKFNHTILKPLKNTLSSANASGLPRAVPKFIFILLTFTFLLAPSITNAEDDANCISFGKNSFSGAQTFFSNMSQKIAGDISRLSLKESFGISKKAGDNLYMSVYKDIVQGSTKETLKASALRYKLSEGDVSKILDGDVTPLYIGSQKGLTYREAELRRAEFMNFYKKEQKFQDFLYETKMEAYPLEVFTNGNVEDSGFDLVNDLDVIEQILFGVHEDNPYQTAGSLGDAGSNNSGASSEASSQGSESSSSGEGASVSTSNDAVVASSDTNASGDTSSASSNTSSGSEEASGNVSRTASASSSSPKSSDSDESSQNSGNSGEDSDNSLTTASNPELNAFICNATPLNDAIQSALALSKNSSLNGANGSSSSETSDGEASGANATEYPPDNADSQDGSQNGSRNESPYDSNGQTNSLENASQNSIGEPYGVGISSDEKDTGYLSSDGQIIALKKASSRSSSTSLCASIFCVEVNLVNKSKPKYPNEKNCIACHVDFIVDSLYRTIQNSLIPGKITGNLYEVSDCKEATAHQLPPDFFADRFVIIGKPISTPIHDDIVKGIDFKKMTSDVTKIFTGNSSNDSKGIGNSTFVANEAARELTYCDPNATPEEKNRCRQSLSDSATAFVQNTVSDGKTYTDILREVDEIVKVAEQNARESSHREITKNRLQRGASWYSSIKPEMDQMEEYFRSFRNILLNIREGAAQNLCNKKDVASF